MEPQSTKSMTKEELIAFEQDIAQLYEEGKIKAPIHLAGTNEDELIKVFKKYVSNTDWIVSTHRNHYHWLLSDRDPDELKRQIIAGHSMHVFGDRFFTSSIVGGGAPIAVGIALALKMKGVKDVKVVCFLGDMAARTGVAMESIAYSEGHDLPILFVIEDNGMSVRADTKQAWGGDHIFYLKNTQKYDYSRKYNHAGPFLDGEKKYVMF